MKTTISFAHDMENGWYIVRPHDIKSKSEEFNQYIDAVKYIENNKLGPYEWAGSHPNPEENLKYKYYDQWCEALVKDFAKNQTCKHSLNKIKLVKTIASYLKSMYNSHIIINDEGSIVKLYAINRPTLINLYLLSHSSGVRLIYGSNTIIEINSTGLNILKHRYEEPLELLTKIIKNYGKIDENNRYY